MEHEPASLGQTIAMLLAAGGPLRFPVATTFAVHAAIRELNEDPASRVRRTLTMTPAPDVGLAVHGLAEGLYDLLLDEVLVAEVSGGEPSYRTDPDRLRPARRLLMRLEPSEAASYRRAAIAWRARCSNFTKTPRSSEPVAVGATTSGTPGIRRQGPAGRTR